MSRTKDHLCNLNALAEANGWEDWEQMSYYESLAEREFLAAVQQLPEPPPSIWVSQPSTHNEMAEIMALAKVDARESPDYEWAGVY